MLKDGIGGFQGFQHAPDRADDDGVTLAGLVQKCRAFVWRQGASLMEQLLDALPARISHNFYSEEGR